MGVRADRTAATVLLGLVACIGCGPIEEPAATSPEGELLGEVEQALATDNGLSLNGLSFNGLSFNGLSFNGLSFNGLSFNGLSSPLFQDWFDGAPALRDEAMRYIVRCAVPSGQQRVFIHPATGHRYVWSGGLGLAPGWAQGAPATVAEQQLVSACLAAHVNTYGLPVRISVLGRTAAGVPIPLEKDELNQFDMSEACFFGNLFNGEGLFAGNDRNGLSAQESTLRHCGLSRTERGIDPLCQPIQRVGRCEELGCRMDGNSKYYTRCTYNGVSYLPITTRIPDDEVFDCGDGVCQASERCGTGTTADNCRVDCGRCR